MWLWDIYDHETKRHVTGDSIETFCGYLFTLPSKILYFHNLKFDGAFLLNFLLSIGFKVSDDKSDGTISTLITDRLTWYTFTVYFRGKKYQFRDSLKKINGELRQAAIDFGLEEGKGEIDYVKLRDDGYVASEEEIEYIHRDTEILSNILEYYYKEGMTSMTNASDAMKTYKKMIGENNFVDLFPVIDKESDDFIRKSYKGGFCYVNPKYKDKNLGKIYCYDVKSMYPSVMVEKPLPYGVPIKYEGLYEEDEIYPLFIQRLRVCCELKEGHIPSIQTKNFLSIKLDYLTTTNGELIELTLTSVDLIHLYMDYDIIDIEYLDGFKFKSANNMFTKYIMYYFKLKEESKGAKKQLYKIFLNSLYGKFAMMTERSKATPREENGVLSYDKSPKEQVDATYTAVASFITAWARDKLLNAIYKNIENFVYCDTDSIHLLDRAKDISEGKNLGQFAIEHGGYENGVAYTNINLGRYLGQKCYIICEVKDGEYIEIKKVAGAPNKVKEQLNMENFHYGFVSDATKYPKFRMKNVKGGVLLIPTSFTIKNK